MTEFAGEWVRGIAGAALVCAAAMVLTPKGRVKNVLKFICGIVLLCSMLNPIIKRNFQFLSMDMSQYRIKADEIAQDAQQSQNNLSRTIIENKLKAYILDKAKSLDAEIQDVSVSVKWGDEGCWYPYEARLRCNIPQKEMNLISNAIESELGIPKERQYWSGYEEEQ